MRARGRCLLFRQATRLVLDSVGGSVYLLTMVTEPEGPSGGGIVLRLGVTGELGQMDFESVLRALLSSYELLRRTAHRVVGDRASQLSWRLSGLQEGSALTQVRTSATKEVSDLDLFEIAETYTRDLGDPARRLPVDDVPLLRELLLGLERTNSGSLIAENQSSKDPTAAVVVNPQDTLRQLNVLAPARHEVIGSVTGRLESLNVHAKREAALYNELDRRRVVVSFPESDYDRIHAALRSRVEIFGVITEDADGRPLRMRMEDIEAFRADDDLPTLGSLAGGLPDLTGGASPEEYLESNRQKLGLG